MSETEKYTSAQFSDLLGYQLNDVESKHSPRNGIFYKGVLKIPLSCPRVSVIGSRISSHQGLSNARKITKFLVENNVITVSGLARGIDTMSHKTAIECGGKTIAVLGTPLNKTYPKENATLQNHIMTHHMAISQYPVNHHTTPKDFVLRNYTMAIISNATIIVEATDSSGTLYHAWEALRIGRPVFFCKEMLDEKLEWPKKILNHGGMILDDPHDILQNIPSDSTMSYSDE